MPFQLYNSLTRRKEPFNQIYDPVRMYVCGVTTYDEPHLGHALATIVFEVLQRYMQFRGMNVVRVQNFTDVDDKIIVRAAELDLDWEDLTQQHIESFLSAMDGLNVIRADVHPRVTEEIDKIVELIEVLVDSGAAYEAEGSVYYRVHLDDDYGKLSRRQKDDTEAFLARLEPDMAKENGEDFALWKAWKKGEPWWNSPWGRGRPGWHIECSAMARQHLGDQIDIHGGGLDLVFPHHENEIAQSETATGIVPFARFWMHNGLLRMGGYEKMSKSLGNFVTVREALDTYTADAIRLWIFQSHYRNPASYAEEHLHAAERAVRRLRQASAVAPAGEQSDEAVDASRFRDEFIEAMDDDLSTPTALASIFELASEIFRGASQGKDVHEAQRMLGELTDVLGITLEEPIRGITASAKMSLDNDEENLDTAAPSVEVAATMNSEVEALIEERSEARSRRDFARADEIRDRLSAMGVEVADTPTGTTWSWT